MLFTCSGKDGPVFGWPGLWMARFGPGDRVSDTNELHCVIWCNCLCSGMLLGTLVIYTTYIEPDFGLKI